MRTQFWPTLILATCFVQISQASVTAPITEVVLYPGSATVVRSVSVAAGRSQIELGGLPTQFDTQTLHADATSGITIGSLVTRDTARTETLSAGEADLNEKIQTLQDQQTVIDANIHAEEIVKGYLERLGSDGTANADKSAAPGDAKRLASIIDTIGHSGKDALLHIQALTVQKRELQKKIDALNRDLNRQRSGNDDARTVTLSIAADKPGTVTLSYQVSNAGWKPTYRASLNSDSGQLELERLAVISQRTGEDWTNVKMTLATSRPNLNPGAPEPQPWLLKYYPPQPRMAGLVAAPAPAPIVASPMAKSVARDAEPMPIYYEVQSNYDTQFRVPTKVDLQSDGREATVTLSSQQMSVKQFARIAPGQSKEAILIAQAERQPGIWLNGQIQLIRDGNYIGATAWQPMDGDKFVLPFGRDNLIKVEKIDLKADSASTGFIEKKAQRQFAWQYVITNQHKGATDIELVVPSPVSTSEEITVKTTYDPKPSSESWKDKRGVNAWNRRLATGESAKFNVSYDIGYPKEGWVAGM